MSFETPTKAWLRYGSHLRMHGHPEFVEKDSLIYRVQGQPGKEEVWERRKHAVGPSHEMPRNSTEAGSQNYNSRTPGKKENYPVVTAAVLRGS